MLVSEVMLQQTSTARVVAPWANFLERFATPTDCANATLADVLRAWQGLGYPRRARDLHRASRRVRDHFAGSVPAGVDELRSLPGVGPYTAAAVASFAFGQREAVLDTNVGRVLARAVSNSPLTATQARSLATRLLPTNDAPAFNQAMIDLGATYCRATPKCAACPVSRVCRWNVDGGADPAPRSAAVSRSQASFAGSDRQIRGRVIAELGRAPRDVDALAERLADVDARRLEAVVQGLVDDGLVKRTARRVALSDA